MRQSMTPMRWALAAVFGLFGFGVVVAVLTNVLIDTDPAAPKSAAPPSSTRAASAAASLAPVQTSHLQFECTSEAGFVDYFDRYEDTLNRLYRLCEVSVLPPLTDEDEQALRIAYGNNADDSYLSALWATCALTDPDAFTTGRYVTPLQAREYAASRSLCPKNPVLAAAAERTGRVVARRQAARLKARQFNQAVDAGLIFFDGTYRVGRDVQPGTYAVRTSGDGCYWERTNSAGEIIDNNFSNGLRSQVTIYPSDYSITSSNCGTWRRVE